MTGQLDLGGMTPVDRAIERLRMFAPPEGYFLCFSGGKDSVTIKALADMAGVKYEAHYSVTTIDPPPLVQFIRRAYPDVQWDRAAHGKTFWRRLSEKGFPTRRHRWCCGDFKEKTGRGRVKLMGLRKAERRASQTGGQVVRICYGTGERWVSPIWDWSDTDVWAFIKGRKLPYCELYDQGWKRIGCVCCPFASAREMNRSRERWPGMFRQVQRGFRILFARRESKGAPSITRWADADSCFEWWLRRDLRCPPLGARAVYERLAKPQTGNSWEDRVCGK
jgi:phosphoadenosine phosphosulfate reductase